jgi:hypothetical protein
MDDDPYLERIRRICLAFPEVEEVEMWGGPLFRVRRRRFALFNGPGFPHRSLHVVTDPAERDALLQDDRFEVSTHHPQQGWMAMNLEAAVIDWDEVTELLETAYRHVIPKNRR